MKIWQQIEQDISAHLNRVFSITDKKVIAGGSINNAYRISDGRQSYFVKTNRKQLLHMFEAESQGLEALFDSHTITVPEPVKTGISGQECYFVMSWLELSGQPNSERFANKLAAMHRCSADQFGFHVDNTIGSTEQLNQWSNDWVDFWNKQRLGYQLDLALKNGFGHRLFDLGMNLKQKSAQFFSGYQPRASLLHGDLWSGNWAGDQQGDPVIYDPATYYGDREADLAMMELFGHPGQTFIAAYHANYAIDPGYKLRKNFYNLYHILNHANLFGSSYAMQAENMIETLLAEVS